MSDDAVPPVGGGRLEWGAEPIDLREVIEDNPLIGKSLDEMEALNERGVICQSIIRGVMLTGLAADVNPIDSFCLALQAVTEVCLRIGDRDMAAYLIGLGDAFKAVPGGPTALLHGVIRMGCAVKAGEEIPEEVRKKYNLTARMAGEGDAPLGVEIRREGNVVDATDLFKGRKPDDPIH